MIEGAVAMADSRVIELDDLPPALRGAYADVLDAVARGQRHAADVGQPLRAPGARALGAQQAAGLPRRSASATTRCRRTCAIRRSGGHSAAGAGRRRVAACERGAGPARVRATPARAVSAIIGAGPSSAGVVRFGAISRCRPPHMTSSRRFAPEAHVPARHPRRPRRPDGAVRRLGHAGRVLRHHRRAPGRAHRRRAVRRLAHGRDRAGRPERAGRRAAPHQQRRRQAAGRAGAVLGADHAAGHLRRRRARLPLGPSHFLLVVNASNIDKDYAWIAEHVKARRRGRRRQLEQPLRAHRRAGAEGARRSSSR